MVEDGGLEPAPDYGREALTLPEGIRSPRGVHEAAWRAGGGPRPCAVVAMWTIGRGLAARVRRLALPRPAARPCADPHFAGRLAPGGAVAA
jgi:hypothetical protein